MGRRSARFIESSTYEGHAHVGKKRSRLPRLADSYGRTVQPTVKAVLEALADVYPTTLPSGRVDYFKQVFDEEGTCISAVGKGRSAQYYVSYATHEAHLTKSGIPLGRKTTQVVEIGSWVADEAEEAARKFLESVQRNGFPRPAAKNKTVINDPDLQFLAEL